MAKRINDIEVRKRQILEKASELFLEKGYAGVGIDDIAKACGIVRGTVLRYFHSKKELYDEILYGRGNKTGSILEQYCSNENIPVTEAVTTILLSIMEKQFVENIGYYGEKLKGEEFRQNFEVLRLPIFRSEADMVEKLIIRGNAEGVLHIENPKVRAYSFVFALFGLAEVSELDTDVISHEIWEIAETMLQVSLKRTERK